MNLLKNKKALILGVANEKSIAYGITKMLKANGASIALTYPNPQMEKRVVPIAEEFSADFVTSFDASNEEEYKKLAETVREKWGTFDILIHSIAFAPRETLKNPFFLTSMNDFSLTMNISAYSLVGLTRELSPLFTDGGSVITLSYHGSQKVIPGYNVMGVAKATLEASVRYLANDFGDKNIRINAISAGPIKTLAASAVGDFRSILGRVEETAPLRENISIEDVANSALYLSSELSSKVTGQILYVDSGHSIMASH